MKEFEIIRRYTRRGESDMYDVTDVGGLVRCKDCKWWHTDGVCRMLSSNHYPVVYMEAEDFCSRNKRKDEVEE